MADVMGVKQNLSIPERIIWALFDYIPYRVDSLVRNLDRELFRTDSDEGVIRRLFQARGHSIILFFLFSLMMWFAIGGPTWDTYFSGSIQPLLLLLLALLSLLILGRKFWLKLYSLQLSILFITVVWIAAYTHVENLNIEAQGGLYKHLYLALAPIMMALPFIASLSLKFLFKSLDNGEIKKKLSDGLAHIELFEDRASKSKEVKVGFTLDRLFNSVMLAIFYNPLLLLLLPSFVVLIIPERHDLWIGFFSSLVLSFILLLYGRLRVRWHMLVQLVERATTNGLPLAISVAVFLAALGRLFNFSYVSIFLDGTRSTIWGYLLAFYAFAWMFEYWINRFLNERLLSLFSASLGKGDYLIPYRYIGTNVLDNDITSKRERVLQIHGGSRFMVRSVIDKANPPATIDPEKPVPQWFHSYTRDALLERLLFITPDQETFIANKKLFNVFLRKIRIYFFSLNTIMVLALVGFVYSQNTLTVAPLYQLPSNQSLLNNNDQDCSTVDANDLKQGFRLDCAIQNFSLNRGLEDNESGSAILVAASGGGTRAALHTASVLYGLRTENLSQDIILMSGVSGGGVSSAYYSQHVSALNDDSVLATCPDFVPTQHFGGADPFADYPTWACYFSAMSHPYIKDVVEGMAEWRILGDESNGVLLKESLSHQFSQLSIELDQEIFNQPDQNTFQALKTHGLILNSTLTGHRYFESKELGQRYRDRAAENFIYSVFQGGRLAFTNLANTAELQFESYDSNNLELAFLFKAFNFQGMKLSTASAMTANFPPVFSDARLCLSENCEQGSKDSPIIDYYVTDGGATHNQGLLSLLAATESAVKKIKACDNEQQHPLPRLHIVVAEASYGDFDYSEGSRGLGAAISSSYGLGNGIVGQQFRSLQRLYDQRFKSCQAVSDDDLASNPSVQIHTLALPRMFRSRGGMGTHWMMPPEIEMSLSNQPDKNDPTRIELTRSELQSYFAKAYSHYHDLCSVAQINSDDNPNKNTIALCQSLIEDGWMYKGAKDQACTPWLNTLGQLRGGGSCLSKEPQ